MRRNLFLSTVSALWMGVVALALTACSNDDNIGGGEKPASARTYSVCIPASLGDGGRTRAVEFDNTGSSPKIITKFVENERVYVYNKDKNEVLTAWNDVTGDYDGYLEVKNVSADGLSCDLMGQLRAPIAAGNEILLMYNLTAADNDKTDDAYKWCTNFDYSCQEGTPETVTDGAISTMVVESTGSAEDGYKLTLHDVTDNTKTAATFANIQSMFRLQFKDASTGNNISVKSLKILSQNDVLATMYHPLQDAGQVYGHSDLMIVPSTPIAADGYVYVALCFDHTDYGLGDQAVGDVLTFHVMDASNNEYKVDVPAPTGGFQNGQYYYFPGPVPVVKQPARVMPAITWTNAFDSNGSNAPEFDDISHFYDVYGSGVTDNHNNDIDFTLANPSGKSLCNGCKFYLYQGGTVRLNGINAIWSDDSYPFIYCESDLTIDITGNNSISCPLYGYTIDACGTLKLRGNGTLTVTGNEDGSYGLCGEVNYNYSDGLFVSKLAAPGYTVTLSATTDNGDGTFTWTYTVAPASNNAYYDPQGNEIQDDGVIGWLRDKGFAQADINALGNNDAATDKMYECWLYNCDFRVAGAGFVSLEVINTTSEGGYIKTVTVQLTRKAPLGRINGCLYLYANGSTQPIPDESVEFLGDDNDPFFAFSPSTGEVTQDATGTFNNSVTATTVTAEITVQIVDNGEEP